MAKNSKSSYKTCGNNSYFGYFFKAKAASIGDSRAVLVRNGSAIRFTEDHKPCNDDEEERIRALGGWVTRDEVSRVNGSLAVSRSIGDFYMHPLVSTEPFLRSTELTPADEYLIIACDGLWDVFSDEEAAVIAIKAVDVKAAAVKLRDLAYLRGSDDNISVVVIDLKNPPTNEELKVKPVVNNAESNPIESPIDLVPKPKKEKNKGDQDEDWEDGSDNNDNDSSESLSV